MTHSVDLEIRFLHANLFSSAAEIGEHPVTHRAPFVFTSSGKDKSSVDWQCGLF